MGAPATGSGNPRMLRSIVTYIRYLHINSGIERNGGRSHVGTAAPAVQASAERRGFRLAILALEGGARLPPLDSRGRGSLRFGWVRLAKKALEVRGQKWAVAMGGNGPENVRHRQHSFKR